MTAPLFSVVIPTFSRPIQLRECLTALAAQRFESFEAIIVDDGAPAPPQPVAAEFAPRLNVSVVRTNHGGPAAARNHGVQRARGRFLAFTDDDCRPAPGWLEALAQCLRAHPDHLVGGRTLNALVDNPCAAASQLILDVVYRHYNGPQPGGARFFATNNMAMAAERLRAIGGFDPDFTTSEDRELCDRWARRGGALTYAPDALVYHAHRMRLRDFWRQHFGYGRGAWRYHQSRARHGAGQFHPDWKFYRRLLAAPFVCER